MQLLDAAGRSLWEFWLRVTLPSHRLTQREPLVDTSYSIIWQEGQEAVATVAEDQKAQDGEEGNADMKDDFVQRCVAKIHAIRITASLKDQDVGATGQRD